MSAFIEKDLQNLSSALYDTNEWDVKQNCPGLLSELGHLLHSYNQWNVKQSRDFNSNLFPNPFQLNPTYIS